MVTKRILSYLSKLSGGQKNRDRRYPRLRAYNLIKFTTSDGTRYESISNIIDISENGLQFTCYEELKPGQDLRIVINIPHAGKDVPLKARLKWLRRSQSPKGVFVAGVQFEQISDENRQLIRGMVSGDGKAFSRRQ